MNKCRMHDDSDCVLCDMHRMGKPSDDERAIGLLQKIESAAHGHCDGARLVGKRTPGIRQIAEWAAEAQKILND